MDDVARTWQLAEKESEYQIKQGSNASCIGLEIRYALIYTSINSLSANIPLELLVAFLETKKWAEAKVLMYAQKEPNPIVRVMKLISIFPKIKDECIKRDFMEKALDAASEIRTYCEIANTLSALVPYLDGQKKGRSDGKSPRYNQ